ncbi:MAG: PepSY-like domain-containing protein [Muribaculaceae bacterium]|nr:PepSY-like domain-containing protein [Muribaculaceae bacterium]
MKKLLTVVILLGCIFCASARDSYTRDKSVLPSAARIMVEKNFQAEVNHIKIDKEYGKVSEYDVILNDGTEISFDPQGRWTDIEVQRNGSVPGALIPASISSYIKQTHNNASIIGIEKKKTGYEVELSDGVELIFNQAGKFIRYDK